MYFTTKRRDTAYAVVEDLLRLLTAGVGPTQSTRNVSYHGEYWSHCGHAQTIEGLALLPTKGDRAAALIVP